MQGVTAVNVFADVQDITSNCTLPCWSPLSAQDPLQVRPVTELFVSFLPFTLQTGLIQVEVKM